MGMIGSSCTTLDLSKAVSSMLGQSRPGDFRTSGDLLRCLCTIVGVGRV